MLVSAPLNPDVSHTRINVVAGYLLFIDTNILLDFYRLRTESGLKLLAPLDDLHDRLIMTDQVEMEFKKNRHAAIRESLKNLKGPQRVPHAAFLADTQAANKLDRVVDDAGKRVKKMRTSLERILAKPTTHDPVYKVVQRAFVNTCPLNLKRDNKQRRQIKRAAFRRFILGYPPRKKEDTSIGDAFNWEWIVSVAQDTGCHVIIVSRDSDFGTEIDGHGYVNDWLIQEFRDRVAKKRKLELHTRLSSALKEIEFTIPPAVVEEEDELVSEAISRGPRNWPEIGGSANWVAEFEKFIQREWESPGRRTDG